MQKTRKRKEWIIPATWKDIERRRRLKRINDSRSVGVQEKDGAEYSEVNRRVKRKIRRTDKRAGKASRKSSYRNFSLHCYNVWQILRAYGIPSRLVVITRSSTIHGCLLLFLSSFTSGITDLFFSFFFQFCQLFFGFLYFTQHLFIIKTKHYDIQSSTLVRI